MRQRSIGIDLRQDVLPMSQITGASRFVALTRDRTLQSYLIQGHFGRRSIHGCSHAARNLPQAGYKWSDWYLVSGIASIFAKARQRIVILAGCVFIKMIQWKVPNTSL